MAFEPKTDLPPFSVILVPYTFENATVRKIFVVICHEVGFAFCIKTTSNLTFYQNSPGLLSGCVPYKKGEIEFFSEDTVVQPDNQFPISHSDLIEAHNQGALEILGTMPADFPQRQSHPRFAWILEKRNESSNTLPRISPSSAQRRSEPSQ